jgi:hypothetical protein
MPRGCVHACRSAPLTHSVPLPQSPGKSATGHFVTLDRWQRCQQLVQLSASLHSAWPYP